jgi:hypothetical protein
MSDASGRADRAHTRVGQGRTARNVSIHGLIRGARAPRVLFPAPRRKFYFKTPQGAFIRECSARAPNTAREVRVLPGLCQTRALCGKNELCL